MLKNSPVLDSLFERSSNLGKRIALPDAADDRTISAAKQAADSGLCKPVLIVEDEDNPEAAAGRHDGLEYVSPASMAEFDALAESLFELRRHKGMSLDEARAQARRPLYLAGLMLRAGLVDGCVAGSLSTTADVLRAGIHTVGLAPGMSTISSFFMMVRDGLALAFADCGVVPDPNVRQLADITIATCHNFLKLINQTPRAALLAFSTKGSAEHESLHKMRECLTVLRSEKPDLLVDGELQFDAAFVPAIAQRKSPDSPIGGRANVFIFPDLNSGNIAYKIAERLGGMQAIGPNVQGLDKPYLDLSRGCSADDISVSMAIASILSETR